MKLHVVSDLHTELNHYHLHSSAINSDVIILPGDIGKGLKAYEFAEEQATKFNKPVIFICGNHEFYGSDINALRKVMHERYISTNPNPNPNRNEVYYLENTEIVLGNVRFLGATLWTDLELFNDKSKVIKDAPLAINDFIQIKNGKSYFSPEDSIALHLESLNWLEKSLNEPFEGKTVVITHHLPSILSVSKKYINDPLSACFASNLDFLFGKCDLWIHGHTHDSFDYTEKGTRVICNPRGYSRFDKPTENSNFDPTLIVEV